MAHGDCHALEDVNCMGNCCNCCHYSCDHSCVGGGADDDGLGRADDDGEVMVYVGDDDDLGDELDDCSLLPPRPCGWGRF